MSDIAIKVEHVSKEYRLGMIGGTTLKADLQRLWAKMRGKEDPTAKIGTDSSHIGERFLALDDVSFEVKQGEALGIIGRNGAGKSTLLKLLARVTAPTKGRISYNGRIASMLEVGTGFHGELSGRENIYMNGAILGMSKKEINRKLDEITAFAEMEQFIDTPVKRYSSGMYVKLAFSVAAHLDAEIMIMDEVLAVGDMKFQQKCLGRMNDAAHNEGRTVLFVSHNMGAVRQLCTTGMLLDHGKLMYSGAVDSVTAKYFASSLTSVSGFYDLASIKNRIGDKRIRFTGFSVLDCQKNVIQTISLGENVTFMIEFESTMDLDGDAEISFALDTAAGVRVGSMGLRNKNLRAKIHRGKNTILFHVLRWPIAPGSYIITLYSDIEKKLADRIEDSLLLEVVDGHFHNKSQCDQHNGLAFFPYDVEFEK